uniref:Serpin domain-containing protein n=1 Tax=Panagrolaimus davidi TaxID=227884 RepID=A0A914Q1F2_9BILA
MDGSVLLKLAQNQDKKLCEIQMPRFKVTYRIGAKEILETMGIKNAFDPTSANFSNFSPDKSTFLHNILHGVSITLYEHGNESAFVYVSPASITVPVVQPEISFKADHPFFYFIIDKKNNILAVGTIVDGFQP